MIAIVLLLIHLSKISSYGYDSGTDQGACGKPYRSGREYKPPCDLIAENYCTKPGSAYPWKAVTRFVQENHGLMRRMYGDQNHILVLQTEIQTNDLKPDLFKNRYGKQEDLDNELHPNDNIARFLQEASLDDVLTNTKFVYSEEPDLDVKVGDLRTVPQFKTTEKTHVDKKTILEAVNKSIENFTKPESENLTTDSTTDTTTNGGYTTEIWTTSEHASSTTEALESKEKTGEVLFQDMEPAKKTPVNFKLKGINACPVKEEVVAPFWANNTRGEVLALLNLYPFEQYVHWEKCAFEHRQMYCREGCRCEQQYRLHRLLAYDPNNECRGIFSDWFKFPSCCVCKCYDIPTDFRVTSRSPRQRAKDIPDWFINKNQETMGN